MRLCSDLGFNNVIISQEPNGVGRCTHVIVIHPHNKPAKQASLPLFYR